jgi:putative cell wall-binding protein
MFRATVERVSGEDRYATTASVDADVVDGTDTIFVVTGKTFGDALTGIPIAAMTGSGVLMVCDGGLHPTVVAELRRLRPKNIVVLGGTAAVARQVEEQLAQYIGDGTGGGTRGLQITPEDVEAAKRDVAAAMAGR